jgi:hypothetical protein
LAKKKKVETPKREYTRRQISHIQKQRRRQRIIFFGGIAVIVAVVIIVVIGWMMGEYVPMHKTVLKINDTEFDMGYYIDVMEIVALNQSSSSELSSNIQMIASGALQQIAQGELIRQGAGKLGITVSEEEVDELLGETAGSASDGYRGLIQGQLLQQKLKDEYFGAQVPESDRQVHALAMLVESERQALEITERLNNSENFTALAGEFAQNYYSKSENQGDFGWHPESILLDQMGSQIPVDYAFSADIGVLSAPLHDEEAYMQLGYWLLRVNERPTEISANVSALLISSQELAEQIKERLEAGEELGPIADEYSNYSPSRDNHGELGMVPLSENISIPFNDYVYNTEVELGKWSDPIFEDKFWSKGGYWLVEAVDREEDRKVSEEDRTYLISQLYDNWTSTLSADPENIIDQSNLTEELRQWAIKRVLKNIQDVGG